MVDDAGDPGLRKDAIGSPRLPIAMGTLVLLLVILLAALLGDVLLYVFITAQPAEGHLNEVVVLVGGFGTVVLLLYIGTVVLRALDLGARGEALGMPQGSIRALIAMSLILIFAIVGFVVLKSGSGTPGESRGLTQAQIDMLRADGTTITSQNLIDVPAGQPAPSAGQERYDVATIQPMTADEHDFGLQLLSTVSTLVVAVAGFYFGAKSVSQASKAIQAQQILLRRPTSEAASTGVVGTLPDEPAPDANTGQAGDEPDVSEIDTVAGAGAEDGTGAPGAAGQAGDDQAGDGAGGDGSADTVAGAEPEVAGGVDGEIDPGDGAEDPAAGPNP